MRRPLVVDLSSVRARQVEHMAALLGVSPEAVLQLALDLCMSEWREIVPELKGLEAGAGPARRPPGKA